MSPCTTRVDWSKFGSEDAGDTRRVAREEAATSDVRDSFRFLCFRPRTSVGAGFQTLHTNVC